MSLMMKMFLAAALIRSARPPGCVVVGAKRKADEAGLPDQIGHLTSLDGFRMDRILGS